ncbi:unnamed protein product [Linum trigynum]|uniref:Uncharacterized protein n=1 Tax=Linum trigynum TaxID=586398 RepID=A0AAV2E6K7_9ROSI
MEVAADHRREGPAYDRISDEDRKTENRRRQCGMVTGDFTVDDCRNADGSRIGVFFEEEPKKEKKKPRVPFFRSTV